MGVCSVRGRKKCVVLREEWRMMSEGGDEEVWGVISEG